MRKINPKAIGFTLVILFFLFGTLWLCINVSWWFAILWVAVPCYLGICLMYAFAEFREDDAYNGRITKTNKR